MTLPTAFQKRIKRQVTARDHDFFAVTTPGLERLCAQELARLDPPPYAIEPITGGVVFRGRLTTLYQANLHLRTATRILMRLARFKATRFDQIHQKLSDFPWELFLFKDQSWDVIVTTRQSRLYHREAIAEQVQRSIQERLENRGVPAGGTRNLEHLQVRFEQDRATVSLDSSGVALYKRGLKTQGARAPLRETLAAAVLTWAGYQPERPLVDPMCGGGTFSLEAAGMALGIPAGMRRAFAFEGWPAFRPNHWDHLRSKARSDKAPAPQPRIFASDREAAICAALMAEVKRNGLAHVISVVRRDLKALKPADLPSNDPPGLVVLNPPYGIRLGSRSQAHQAIAALGRHLRTHWKGWRVAVILPERSLARHFGRSLTLRPFRHGGLDLTLMIGQLR